MRYNPIILALDKPNISEALEVIADVGNNVGAYKIGFEFFVSGGIEAIRAIQEFKAKIFLDLKFHDIPNTVASASKAAVRLGVDFFNIHAAGGYSMMKASVDAVLEESSALGCAPPKVLAVTVLTSFDESTLQADTKTSVPLRDMVKHYATQAASAGVDGVIASPQEIRLIREVAGPDFLVITPGVRPAWTVKNDQKRVMTPAEAISEGADYLVIGRPIHSAKNPKSAAQKILAELEN